VLSREPGCYLVGDFDRSSGEVDFTEGESNLRLTSRSPWSWLVYLDLVPASFLVFACFQNQQLRNCPYVQVLSSSASTTSHLYPPCTMRPGVAVLSLFSYILVALAALHRRPTLAHRGTHLDQLTLPLSDYLSWFLPEVTPDDLNRSAYATGSTKPIIAQ